MAAPGSKNRYGGEATVERLRGLGDLLHDHVRFEERELFPLIEEDLDGDAVRQLAERIERFAA